MTKKNFKFTDCKIISYNGKTPRVFEVNKTAILQWNLNGFPNIKEVFDIKYINKVNNEIKIATAGTETNNETVQMNHVNEAESIFTSSRVVGSVNLVNGNGTATFELKNVQYDEDGNFTLETFNGDKLSIAIIIQGNNQIYFTLSLLLLDTFSQHFYFFLLFI